MWTPYARCFRQRCRSQWDRAIKTVAGRAGRAGVLTRSCSMRCFIINRGHTHGKPPASAFAGKIKNRPRSRCRHRSGGEPRRIIAPRRSGTGTGFSGADTSGETPSGIWRRGSAKRGTDLRQRGQSRSLCFKLTGRAQSLTRPGGSSATGDNRVRCEPGPNWRVVASLVLFVVSLLGVKSMESKEFDCRRNPPCARIGSDGISQTLPLMVLDPGSWDSNYP